MSGILKTPYAKFPDYLAQFISSASTSINLGGNQGVRAVLAPSRQKRLRRVEGSIVRIPLDHNSVAYGLVLREPLIAIFEREFKDNDIPDVAEIMEAPVAFQLMVMNHAITSGRWAVVERVTVPDKFKLAPAFCKKDPISGMLSIYQEVEALAPNYERQASIEECKGLETAAIWDPEHVEDRLRDHFAGRSNIWVEQLRI